VPASLWYIGWDGSRRKSPPWLGMADWPVLRSRPTVGAVPVPPIFARKFATGHDTAVLDLIDRDLRRMESS
jgi:hypothetical protein